MDCGLFAGIAVPLLLLVAFLFVSPQLKFRPDARDDISANGSLKPFCSAPLVCCGCCCTGDASLLGCKRSAPLMNGAPPPKPPPKPNGSKFMVGFGADAKFIPALLAFVVDEPLELLGANAPNKSSKAEAFGFESDKRSGVTAEFCGSLDSKPPSRSKLGCFGKVFFAGASGCANDDKLSRSIGGAGFSSTCTGTVGSSCLSTSSLGGTVGGFDGRGGGGFDFVVGFVTKNDQIEKNPSYSQAKPVET